MTAQDRLQSPADPDRTAHLPALQQVIDEFFPDPTATDSPAPQVVGPASHRQPHVAMTRKALSMINEQESTGRTRPFTYPETLRAVAHALERPNANLAEPEINRLRPAVATAQTPTAELVLDDGRLAGITAWAQVMTDSPTVVLTCTSGPAVCVRVKGVLPTGPTVLVLSWIDELPIEMNTFSAKDITLDDLVALSADAVAPVATPATDKVLVGAR